MKRLATFAVALVVLLSCRPGQLQRTSTAEWATQSFKAIGAQIDIPRSASIQDAAEFGVVIAMHRIDPALGVLDDPGYLMKVSIRRVAERQIAENLRLLEREAPAGEKKEWELWISRVNLQTASIESSDYTYYRRDVPCGTAEFLRLKAEVRHGVRWRHIVQG